MLATVLSTLVILWKEIDWILKGLFKFQMNEETKYALNIVISMIPVGIVGVFFKDKVEAVFGSGLLIVGCMLLVTAALLTFSYLRQATSEGEYLLRCMLSSSVSVRRLPYCQVFPVLVLPLPPVFCWAIRRRRWLSSHSSW